MLNEENYKKAEKKISIIAVLVLIIGLSLGGLLIYNGVAKPSTAKVDKLATQLENKRKELVGKGIEYDSFARYTDGEVYDLKIITEALDPSFSYCGFSEFKDNALTREYCAAKNKTSDFNSTSSTMFGIFICIASCIISLPIFMIAKRRNMLAFGMQQVMPVAQEGLEKMAPTVSKVGAEIAKEMTPVYKDVAKEISKGIKEGLKDGQE